MSKPNEPMRARDIVLALQHVHELYPDAHAVSDRPHQLDFYNQFDFYNPPHPHHPTIDGGIPVATLDLLTGKLTFQSRENVTTQVYPAAVVEE